MNINTDIDDFHMGFLPLRLVGLGRSQNRKMELRLKARNAHFSGVRPHRMCLLISKSLRYGKHRFSASVHTLAVLAILRFLIIASAIFKWKLAATAALAAKKQNGRALSMAA